jgi:diguanylate cyclase (GGDEF)-like protein
MESLSRAEAGTMSELASLFAQYGIQPLLERTQILIAQIDFDGKLKEWNPAFERMKASHPDAASIQDFLLAASQPVFAKLMQAKEPRQASLGLSFGPKGYHFECLLVPLPDGGFLFCAEPAMKPREAELSRLTRDLKMAKRALKLRKIELESVLVQAYEVSHTDVLTFLPNRRQIIADLQREVTACNRYHKPLTIFMLDIDHFKRVNDSFGHAAGDRVLQVLAQHLMSGIREVDKVGRYGGEEFIILLPGTDERSASKLAERLLEVVRELEIDVDQQVLKVTVSIGIAEYQIGEENWEELLKRADLALYQSKGNGRDQWSVSEFS